LKKKGRGVKENQRLCSAVLLSELFLYAFTTAKKKNLPEIPLHFRNLLQIWETTLTTPFDLSHPHKERKTSGSI